MDGALVSIVSVVSFCGYVEGWFWTWMSAGQATIGPQSLIYFCRQISLYWLNVRFLCGSCRQEEMKAQVPRYQRLIPRPGQAHAAAAPVAAVGSIMAPQPGLPPQQPGMRHPMHSKKTMLYEIL